ncbi:NADH-cytochrome b5 reductase 2 [Rhipicephalus sanguineus]|uniref:NADH-cytochrome b5 reductase 2 n=1 Tax=Rhipicephalus sanguineus TaxID=34632 RepID=UPI0020C2B8C4|nr:NADH-cytochrome b5 reductase 2 [Rhipicephalus sanguineus]
MLHGRAQQLLIFVASAAATFGAVTLAVLLIRKIGAHISGDVLLVDPNARYTVRLERRITVTHNVRLLRFSLRSRYQRLGIYVGQHILVSASIHGCPVTRHYTPVTRCDQTGHFDIMVKVYRTGESDEHPEGGLMSQFLDTMRRGERLTIQGPRGTFIYEGQGHFVTVDGSRLPQASWMGLVAAGSGVTPMLQLLRHALVDEKDETKIKMIDVNRTEDDIIARRELDQYAKVHAERFSLCHVLSKPPAGEGAIGFVAGPLTSGIMAEYLPSTQQRYPGALVWTESLRERSVQAGTQHHWTQASEGAVLLSGILNRIEEVYKSINL